MSSNNGTGGAPPPTQTAEPTPSPAAMTTTQPGPAPGGAALVLWPRSIDEALKLATLAATAGLYGVKSREDAFIRMATGMEVGLTPWQAMRSIYVIDGRPSMSADLLVALCLRAKDVCERFHMEESTAEKATYVAKRIGQPDVRLTWTMKQAERAGLSTKTNWRAHPEAMLRARCAAALARLAFPELALGLYTPDELGDAREMGKSPGTVITITPDGEVIEEPIQSRAAQAATAVPVVEGEIIPNAPARDWEKEKAQLLAEIEAAKAGGSGAGAAAARKALRDKIAKSDLPEPWITEVKNAYNTLLAAPPKKEGQP